MKSFRPNQKVLEIMEDIEYGERSKWVNACCEKHGEDAKRRIEDERNFPGNSNGSEDFSTSKNPSSEPPKPLADQVVTIHEPSRNSPWITLLTSEPTKNSKNSEEKQ